MNPRNRTALLLLLLVLAAALYFYTNPDSNPPKSPSPPGPPVDKSSSLPLGEETKRKIRYYFEEVKLDAKENDLNFAIRLDHSVGRPQISQGNYRDAYRTYQKVLAISYHHGSLMGIGIGLIMLSDVAERANDIDEALNASLLAYRVSQKMNNKAEIGVAELRLARLLKAKDLGLSMTFLLRARESLKGTPHKEDEIRVLTELASGLRKFGEKEKASQTYREAWNLARALGDSPTHKWTKSEAGIAYADDLIEKKEYDRALQVLLGTQRLFSKPERSSENYTHVLTGLARVNAWQKNDTEARRYYLSAYANYELSRAHAPGEIARAKLDSQHKGLVDNFVGHYVQSKDYQAALALLESNKARTLNDILEDPSQKAVQTQWKEMERRHAKEVMGLLEKDSEELEPFKEDRAYKVIETLKKQHEERRKLQANLRLKEITVTRSLSGDQVEDLKRRLTKDIAVVSFFVGAERISAFVVTQNSLRYIPLSLDPGEGYRAAQQMRVALTNPHNDFYRDPAQLLHDKLLKPVLTALPTSVRTISYSPDGILSRVPLAALMDGRRFLAGRYAFYSVPSLRYLAGTVKARAAQNGIACVDPEVQNARLPFQQETGEVLKKLYGGNAVLLAGKECAESKLAAAISGQNSPAFLHIGAHGNFYPNDAMDSAILLSGEDGSGGHVWNAKAMATVDMSRLDLVTLSSCETGLTDPSAQRDVFGIARALFFAGAKRIVAPLWAVQDQATAEFMQAFYRSYNANHPAVLALQQAQKRLMQSERYGHPYYWSGFVLTGVGR